MNSVYLLGGDPDQSPDPRDVFNNFNMFGNISETFQQIFVISF